MSELKHNAVECYECEEITEFDPKFPDDDCGMCGSDDVKKMFIVDCPQGIKRGDPTRCGDMWHHYGYGDKHVYELEQLDDEEKATVAAMQA